ncbi:MAG: penicillin-binding transpeptidase domain-containing protein [Anaerostipes sp.]|nr:penicillin-binding transpeptidase domain-containing protein [Anaerostipes sp.]
MKKRRLKTRIISRAMKSRLIFCAAFIAILFVVVSARLTYIAVTKNTQYKKIVLSQQSYNSEVIPYKRGDITDRNGNILATSQKLYNVVLEPKNILENNQIKKETVAALVKYLNVSQSSLENFLKKNSNSYYNVYKKKLTFSQISDLKDYINSKEGRNVSGIRFDEVYERKYPNHTLGCQLLGFVSNEQGTTGIEQAYNSTLSGVNGRRYSYLNTELEQDSSVVETRDGDSVVSTIDINIQKIAENRLKKFEKKYGSKYGSSVLVMNPNSGEVLAMANSNTYDLENPRSDSALSYKYTQSQIASMSKKKKSEAFSELWTNNVISKSFEPGSTYKPFTVAAGLEEGILNGNESFYCDGSQTVGGNVIHCSHRSGHGQITLSQSISLSCNDALMQIGAKEGKKVFTKYQTEFNFGKMTNIDLPGEVNTSALLHSADQMAAVDLATSSFGQSFNSSMIQLATSFCSIVNGGNYYKPHVVRETKNSQGDVTNSVSPTVVKQTVSKETSDKLKSYMKQTVESGTGKKAKISGYSVGGKTGTAQKIPRSAGTYIVSFIGFAPVENPQVVVYVVIDELKNTSQQNTGIAVEMARDVLKESLEDLNVAKTK